mmetsp:Transcript_11487/g.35835  ORF Transcript_11487/g.35835 Transcript_11487/m.35835 type:complete len:437 (-) Transcript_11487:78-1388(-)
MLVRRNGPHGRRVTRLEGGPHEVGDLLLQELHYVPNQGPAVVQGGLSLLDHPVLLPRGRFGLGNLRRDLAERGLLARGGLALLGPVVLHLGLELPVPLVDILNVLVELVDVRQQAEVALLEYDKDLDYLLYVADASGGPDRRECLLEDLDVLLVLLDVPPLDGVEEGSLQDAAVHRLLREGLLLICHHVVPPVLAPGGRRSFQSALRGYGLLLLLLQLADFEDLLLELLGVRLELPPLSVQHLAQGVALLLCLLADHPLLVDAHLQPFHSSATRTNASLQLLEDSVEDLPLPTEQVDLLPQLLVLRRALVEVCDGLYQPLLQLSNLGLLVLHSVILRRLEQLVPLSLAVVLLLVGTQVLVELVQPPPLQLQLPRRGLDGRVHLVSAFADVVPDGAAANLGTAGEEPPGGKRRGIQRSELRGPLGRLARRLLQRVIW